MLSAETVKKPMSVVSLVDDDLQCFKSVQDPLEVMCDATETPRNITFCYHSIQQDTPFLVEDATKDDRFKDNQTWHHGGWSKKKL
jgi:hypothetical protein